MFQTWNWKSWLLSLIIVFGVIIISSPHSLAQNNLVAVPSLLPKKITSISIVQDTLTLTAKLVPGSFRFTAHAPEFLISSKPLKLDLIELVSLSTANNPFPDQLCLMAEGVVYSPFSTLKAGMKPGDKVSIASSILTGVPIDIELYRINDEGLVKPVGNVQQVHPSCDSSSPVPLEFTDNGTTSANYQLSYTCSH